jgi:hypothetical protein
MEGMPQLRGTRKRAKNVLAERRRADGLSSLCQTMLVQRLAVLQVACFVCLTDGSKRQMTLLRDGASVTTRSGTRDDGTGSAKTLRAVREWMRLGESSSAGRAVGAHWETLSTAVSRNGIWLAKLKTRDG